MGNLKKYWVIKYIHSWFSSQAPVTHGGENSSLVVSTVRDSYFNARWRIVIEIRLWIELLMSVHI